MPASNTNEKLLQPNPYAGGRPAQPISMPLSQSNPPGTGGNSSNGNQGPGQNDMTVDGDVSLSGPSTGLNGTPQTNPPHPGGNVQPTNPDSGLTNTVPGMVPGTNGVNGPGQGPSSGNATGWRKVGNDWYYFDPSNGAMVKGWKMVDGLWYYLDSITGIMAKSWIFVGELWYYLEPSAGHMLLGWNYINEEWYYLETTNGNGQMVTGWKEDGEKWYFLFETGAMAHGGWLLIDGKWYCVQDNGEMEAEKILLFEGKKYYVGKDGAMVTKATLPQPEITYKGITYEVADDGVCTEVIQAVSSQYYMGTDEAKQMEYIFGIDPSGQSWSKYAQGLYGKVGKDLVTIEFPVWTLLTNGQKISKKKKLTVHKKVSEIVNIIFNEIYNSDQKFPIDIATTGGYSDRVSSGGKITSLHNFGIAIDINWNANAMFNSSNKITAGDHYSPGTDPLSIPADSIVVKTFKKYQWYWGGQWKNSKDYMHFAYMNH